jgi:hypothetical protein
MDDPGQCSSESQLVQESMKGHSPGKGQLCLRSIDILTMLAVKRQKVPGAKPSVVKRLR